MQLSRILQASFKVPMLFGISKLTKSVAEPLRARSLHAILLDVLGFDQVFSRPAAILTSIGAAELRDVFANADGRSRC